MGFQLNYSALDRCLHRLAFGAPGLQFAAADLESRMLAADFRNVRAERPIFITSLPRAGTTMLLEALHGLAPLASHNYRDMPFVMAPLFWSRFSTAFRQRARLHERAHGDGVAIGFDSPEAFEEILWCAFWPGKYGPGAIALWNEDDRKPEADDFFREHMRKIIALRRPGARDGRYLSKNNANIARLDLIKRMFPDAAILVPVRRPLDHAASLLRQHENFLHLHKTQPFVRRYMADIGHFEFGALHRPIAFPGLAELTKGRNPRRLDYWLAYWIAAFDHIAARREQLAVVSYEAACAGGTAAMAAICASLDLSDAPETSAPSFRPPAPARAQAGDVDPALRERAEALHETLMQAAVTIR